MTMRGEQDRPASRREFLRRVGLLGMGLLGLSLGLAGTTAVARKAITDEVRCCTAAGEQLELAEGDRCRCCCHRTFPFLVDKN